MTRSKLNLYYLFKPYLPWSLRTGMRRILARKKLRTCKNIWPILGAAGKQPPQWSGWPDGKKFALILTHDVEGPRGLVKCRQLMQIEQELGFRSSFNFIPEGDYTVSDDLRHELDKKHFEVGVHDLHHDGKLYRSREEFSKRAEQINKYLNKWKADGFRSGFMHHNLDWIHQLDIKYDASTFDTDPFEPQPDGVHTIFPFWVAGANGDGYAELPYTLAQDSTMFFILQQKTIDIWRRKLDWIADQGGMVLLNVHPDYLHFGGGSPSKDEYSYLFYIELLKYVRQKYHGQYWHVLPRDMAEFCASVRPVKSNDFSRRICMVSYSNYEGDSRVMRYAEALAGRGDSVDVLSIKGSLTQPDFETVESVSVYRLQARSGKAQRGQLSLLLPILRFWLASFVWLAQRHLRRRYDLIHVHNMPDFLVFTALLPKLFGAKIILDIHDIVPEFYASKFHLGSNSFGVGLLKKVERASAKCANHVIISNHLWRDKYAARTGANHKCSVFINNVDVNIFRPRPRTRNDDRLIVLFPGGLQWHQGLDIAIHAVQKVSSNLPRVELHIYGDGNVKDSLIALAHELGLDSKVRFFNPLPLHEIVNVMANADLAIVPKRADSFGNEAYSTKIMEFMSLGVPVVVSNTKIDRYYFNDSVVRFFESGNSDALADAVLDILHNDTLRQDMTKCALEYVASNNWEKRKVDYLQLVDSLNQRRDGR